MIEFKTVISGFYAVDEYGAVNLDISAKEFAAAGFNDADLVRVSIDGKELILPVVPTYRYLRAGGAGLVTGMPEGPETRIRLLTHYGGFAADHGITENRTYPISVEIGLYQAGGYAEEYALRHLCRSKRREDYPHLNDEEFANFREVRTFGMGRGRLFRGSSPFDGDIGRSGYTDRALRDHGIRLVLVLSDTEERARKLSGGLPAYWNTVPETVFRILSLDFQDPESRRVMAEALKDICRCPGPVSIHCKEGQDRTGFLCAVLECLMGASLGEVITDYMLTYEYFYGVERGSAQYDLMSESMLRSLRLAFNCDPREADLAGEAEKYILSLSEDIGPEDVDLLRKALG